MKMRILRSIRFFLLLLAVSAVPLTSFAQVSLRVNIAPPALVVYTQPDCPQEGYLWTPGYWAYGPGGYFWVPGTWVEPPTVGYLWTPGYWGWEGGEYSWNEGYWGSEVGFYGGVNYGFGYGGVGYEGGYWSNNHFSYNTYVNVGVHGNFHNTYNKTVVVNNRTNVSYNGGRGGITARPSAAEASAAHASHSAPTTAQSHQQQAAGQNHALLASVNHGHPAVAGTSKPGEFSGSGAVPARGAPPANNSGGHDAARTNAPPNRPVTPDRATVASQPTRNAERPAQPAARAEVPSATTTRGNASASERTQPSRSSSTPAPSRQVEAPREQTAPRNAPPAAQRQQQQSSPRGQEEHSGGSKSGKQEGR
jgi:hypothetical protein